jgi:hypothetical protein
MASGPTRFAAQQLHALKQFFHQHWNQIGAMAAKTPPTDGVVKLVITG